MGSSVRAGPDSSQTATPLTTGFLVYLKFLSVFKEEKKKEIIPQLLQLCSNKMSSCKTFKCPLTFRYHSGSPV